MDVMGTGNVFWWIGIPVWRARARDTENIYMKTNISDANYQISA